MPRYLLFVSGPDALITNPHAPNATPARFAGRRLRDVPPAPKKLPEDEHPDLIDHYECFEEVLIDHPHLQKAAKKGDGTILCTVEAKTRASADELFAAEAKKSAAAKVPPPPNAPPTGGAPDLKEAASPAARVAAAAAAKATPPDPKSPPAAPAAQSEVS